jgi:DNA-binding CsgD family transcriptional regulator
MPNGTVGCRFRTLLRMKSVLGREVELNVGSEFVRAAAERPARLAIEGEAGIGKTAVWTAITDAAEATGALVLRARPGAGEASMTLSVLGDLLDAAPAPAFETLPDVQRRAIDIALLRTAPPELPLGGRLLGAAVRTLLAELARERPVLVAIDDVQWVDPASATAIAYAARRIQDVPVGLLTARRRGLRDPLDGAALGEVLDRQELAIGPMSLADLHDVLRERSSHAVSRSTLVRIHRATRGNPLFALEIARQLEASGEPRADRPLPVPDSVRDLFTVRVASLPSTTREVMLAAAASRDPTLRAITEALGRDVAADLALAAREGVARDHDGRLEFSHPLYADAILDGATDAERRSVHSRWASTVVSTDDRARHMALAATAPDAEVATALASAGQEAAARAAPQAAAELLAMSIAFTPADEAQALDERRVALGGFLKLSGDTPGAERVLTEAVDAATTPIGRAHALIALANVVYDLDAGPRSGDLALEAITAAASDPEVLVHAHATFAAVEYRDRQLAWRHAREAKRLLDELGRASPNVESFVLYVYAGAEMSAGHGIPMDLVERALALERAAPAPVVSDRISASLGLWLFVVNDDLEGGRRWLEETWRAAVEEGDDGSLPYAMSHVSMLEHAAGDWVRAEEVAREYLRVSIEMDQASHRLAAMYALANVLVGEGREAEARPLIDGLLRDAADAGSLWDTTKGLAVLGALELALGDVRSAAEHLLAADAGRDELGEEMRFRFDGDLAEALVDLGRLDEADHHAARVERRAGHFPSPSRRAIAARCRALVCAAQGDLDRAIDCLDHALEDHERASFPYEWARTELVLGRVRRRRRERTLAQAAFQSAAAKLERLGARLWVERARAELSRVGIRRGSGDDLTESERKVAELAATGMRNRDIAAALFVSPSTVESTIARAYRKLGVRSRAELGARMTHVVHERDP